MATTPCCKDHCVHLMFAGMHIAEGRQQHLRGMSSVATKPVSHSVDMATLTDNLRDGVRRVHVLCRNSESEDAAKSNELSEMFRCLEDLVCLRADGTVQDGKVHPALGQKRATFTLTLRTRLVATGAQALTRRQIRLSLQASSLPKMDVFGSVDAYVLALRLPTTLSQPDEIDEALARQAAGRYDDWDLIFSTTFKRRSRSPRWDPVVVNQFALSGDTRNTIIFEVWDKDTYSSDDFVGACVATLGDLLASDEGVKLQLQGERKRRGQLLVQADFV
ncbi:MAG: hypothetical protein MHM6MM_005130 [Cercozoa sp. M6MM]